MEYSIRQLTWLLQQENTINKRGEWEPFLIKENERLNRT